MRPRQNGRHCPDDIFKCIFLSEDICISIKISLIFVPKGPINNIPTWVQMMAWRRPGDKPLSEPMIVSLLTHICFARPQWVRIACDTIKRRYVQVKYNKETVIVMSNKTHTCFISRLYFNITWMGAQIHTHVDVMHGQVFSITVPFLLEGTDNRWITPKWASNVGFGILWTSRSITVEIPVIWDAMSFQWT